MKITKEMTKPLLRDIKAVLEQEKNFIKGIGEKTKVLLLRHFKSVKRIREAGFDELKEVIGEAKTKALLNGLK